MTDDRKLLEAAARAIGLRVYDWLPGRAGFAHGDSITNRWNPLTDDGAAFRLAVALGMTIYSPAPADDRTNVASAYINGCTTSEVVTSDGPAAATRRAIVRAAATLGANNVGND